MMLIWRSILLMSVVWLMAPLSAQASPSPALETTIPLLCVVLSVPSNAQTTGVFFSKGNAAVSCEVFVHAAELNSAARQPGDPGGTYRRPDTSGYMGWVEGFISGLNYMASINRTAGQGLEPEARLEWILNYCTAHPRERLLSAALVFRDDLIARGM